MLNNNISYIAYEPSTLPGKNSGGVGPMEPVSLLFMSSWRHAVTTDFRQSYPDLIIWSGVSLNCTL